MRIVAVGRRAFVSGFMLSGVEGAVVKSPEDALKLIEKLADEGDVGLIIVSTDISKPIRFQLSYLKARKMVPLIYEVPAPGSKEEVRIEYRGMLRRLLGI